MNGSVRFEPGSKVLVIRWNAIGDMLLSTPVFRALKESIPGCRTTVIAGPRNIELARRLPNIDEVELFDVYDRFAGLRRICEQLGFMLRNRRKGYSLVVDIGTERAAWFAWLCGAPVRIGMNRSLSLRRMAYTHGNPPNNIHAVGELMDMVHAVGIDTLDLGLDMFLIFPDEYAFADEFLSSVDAQYTIGLNIGAANPERRWPVERFAELGLALQKRFPCRLWVNTAPNEWDLRDAYDALAGTPRTLYSPPIEIGQLGAIISRCDLLITNDTGPLHIGIAAKVPTLGIFGPNAVEHLVPLDERPFKGVRGWPMESLTTDEVLAAASEMMAAFAE